MNIKIICWKVKNKLILDEGMELLNESKGLERKIYYQFHKDKVEVSIFESNNFYEINSEKLISKNSKLIILLEEIDDYILSNINEIFKDNYYMILVGKDSISIESNINFFQEIMYLPQLLGDDKISMYSLLLMIIKKLNNEGGLLKDINKCHIIIGCEDSSKICGNIPLFILKRFNSFQRLKSFYLDLYVKEELDLQDLSYIEDSLIDYITYGGMLKVTQSINSKNNKAYFHLIAK